MKKNILILFTIALITACSEDFINRVPTTSSVVENFYSTPEDAKKAISAAYNTLLPEDWDGMLAISEIASDNCAGGGGTGDGGGYQRYDRGLEWPDANTNQIPWRLYYGGLYRANVYLENEGQINWKGKENLQLQYQAEARFLRAYFHFCLTRLFGEIPALDHTLSPNDPVPPKTPAEEIYSLIIEDLEFCAQNGLQVPYPGNPSNWGRATKWAAEAMIGRVYLFYSGYYNDPDINGFTETDARAYVDDVINNSGHALVPEYASLWRVPTYSVLGGDTSIALYAGEMNQEVVWSVTYTSETPGNRDIFQRMIGPRSTNIQPYGNGWGAMPILPSLWNEYDPSDKRRVATILSWDDEGITYNYVNAGQAQYTGYNSKKYDIAYINGVSEASPNWQQNAFEDFMVIRFADVLLMGAELHLLAGDVATAQIYYERVRKRAFGESHITPQLTADQAGIDLIFTERKLELACEGIRYWDILRSCKGDFTKLADILTYIDENDGGDYSQTSDVNSLDVDGNNFVAKKGLFQLPPNELDLMDGAIDQNEGYEGSE